MTAGCYDQSQMAACVGGTLSTRSTCRQWCLAAALIFRHCARWRSRLRLQPPPLRENRCPQLLPVRLRSCPSTPSSRQASSGLETRPRKYLLVSGRCQGRNPPSPFLFGTTCACVRASRGAHTNTVGYIPIIHRWGGDVQHIATGKVEVLQVHSQRMGRRV